MNLGLFLGSAITAIAAIYVAPHASAQTQSADAAATGAVLASTDTRIGRLEFERGYPSPPTVKTLFDQMDFQRATQAYLWSLPLMGFAQWQHEQEQVFGARDTDLVLYNSYRDKLGLLMANATTPYIIGFPNLARTGPLVIEIPPGPIQRHVATRYRRRRFRRGRARQGDGRQAPRARPGAGGSEGCGVSRGAVTDVQCHRLSRTHPRSAGRQGAARQVPRLRLRP